jgi:hypothetical protein
VAISNSVQGTTKGTKEESMIERKQNEGIKDKKEREM